MSKIVNAAYIFNKYANQYQQKYMNQDLFNDSFDFFCNAIEKENATILELACGPGNITKYLLDKQPNFRILATDLSVNMIELAKKNNPTAECLLMDCRDIDKITIKYDAIMCGFCLPYLTKNETLKLIKDTSNLLIQNGILYISTMEDNHNKSKYLKPSSGKGDLLYTNYYEAEYLIEALNKANFDLIKKQRKVYKDHNQKKITDLILIAKKR
jgi:trans-aconitate methyltransferase